MTSLLRFQSSIDEPTPTGIYQISPPSSPITKRKMSLTQTYFVASTARTKLGREAGRADHNLRRLVGHANLLDTLMLELADAEREQEAWFNQSVKKASKPEQPQHIQWIDTIDEDMEDDDSDLESDDGSDIYDEDIDYLSTIPLRRLKSPPVEISSHEIEYDDEDSEDEVYEDEDEYEEELSLTRVASIHSPPELTLDSDDSESSDDESMPSSPEQINYELSEKQRQAITTTNFFNDMKSSSPMEDIIMQQQHQQQPLIAAAC
ncbi:unnamed protein product [Zymoseptoria tritici ST99CH_3D7]|uniref:Uncharacterized protein n=1 Tax=Zymoseptoria tritici (strain ST99CH_3D7) TaxID=1276538 RepID=A0A1X7RIL8_ZYMT9|nr:unnamed protein product [Zymoseptoria tritici ST99CH_3D7]